MRRVETFNSETAAQDRKQSHHEKIYVRLVQLPLLRGRFVYEQQRRELPHAKAVVRVQDGLVLLQYLHLLAGHVHLGSGMFLAIIGTSAHQIRKERLVDIE